MKRIGKLYIMKEKIFNYLGLSILAAVLSITAACKDNRKTNEINHYDSLDRYEDTLNETRQPDRTMEDNHSEEDYQDMSDTIGIGTPTTYN